MERGTKDGFGSTLTSLPDGVEDLVEGQILLPLHPVFCIVAQAGAMKAQETHQSVDAQFAAKDVQCMPFKLLVGHGIETTHNRFSWPRIAIEGT